MPIYAFACAACGHAFDRLQKIADPDPNACPACQADAVRRQVTAPSFRLSGGGWYETDFKKDGDKKRNLAGEGATQSESKPAEPKAEAAPAKADTSAKAATGS
jgi:putative FmdB family regulatory protein